MSLLLLLAVAIGLSLGLFGGGGSILAVPLLRYVAGRGVEEAITSSLLVVGVTAFMALIPHALRGMVVWRTGLVFAATASLGAYAGGRLSSRFDSGVLWMVFVGTMVAAGLAMLRPRPEDSGARRPEPARAAVVGLGVGSLTGLVGAGGGFIIVPALVLLAAVPMHQAVGTSLLVIGLNSMAGLAGHLGHGQVDLGLAASVTAAASAGTLIGSTLAPRISASKLRRGFGGFVLVVAGAVVGWEWF